ncbi:hypothetical protein ACFFLM_21140 [Deinococcus oregonensis]|uniref:Uncharacterized protein n=1 Tax=Deinococcus oregonensis TaxID=1805970 RepID=A0ABV6B433_9DEIO
MIRTHPGIRIVVIAVHFGWAAPVYHKPNAPLLNQSYSAFTDFAPWTWFGWAALFIALLMTFSRPGSVAAQGPASSAAFSSSRWWPPSGGVSALPQASVPPLSDLPDWPGLPTGQRPDGITMHRLVAPILVAT